MRVGIRGFLALLSVTFMWIQPSSSARASDSTDPVISITKFQVTPIGTTATHAVTLSGTLTNPANTALVTPKIDVSAFGPLYSRTAVADVLNGKVSNQDQTQAGELALGDIAPRSHRSWTIKFIGESVFGNSASGVFAVGARLHGSGFVADYIPVPWFYNTSPLQPTSVLFAMPISVLDTSNFATTSAPDASQVKQLSRVQQLTSGPFAQSIGWIIDPAFNELLMDSSYSKAFPESAQKIMEQLKNLALHSAVSPYAFADLGAMHRAKLNSATTAALASTSPNDTLVYSPTNSAIDDSSLSAISSLNAHVLISNTSVSGSALNTIEPYARVHDHSVFVFDAGASHCLSDSNLPQDIFDEQICLSSQIAMMTAGSPSKSRTIIINAPTNWKASPSHVNALMTHLSNQKWMTLISWPTLLNTAAPQIDRTLAVGKLSKLPPTLIAREHELAVKTRTISQAIGDPKVPTEIGFIRLRGFSTLWTDYATASEYIGNNSKILSAINSSIAVQAANRITKSNTQSSIPVTVVNHSQFPMTVKVHLAPTQMGRITANDSALTLVPSKQRVTIPVPVTLHGTGVVNVEVILFTSGDLPIGQGAKLEITSSTFERLARVLVFGAFGLLVVLAISNFIRRKFRNDQEESDQESAGD